MRPRTQVRELQRQGNASLVMALAGNKADLTEKRKVDSEVPFLPPAPAKGPRSICCCYVILPDSTMLCGKLSTDAFYHCCRRRKPMQRRTACSSWRPPRSLRPMSMVKGAASYSTHGLPS